MKLYALRECPSTQETRGGGLMSGEFIYGRVQWNFFLLK